MVVKNKNTDYALRQREKGFQLVSVYIPIQDIDSLKKYAERKRRAHVK